jgi:hypothetical protein
MANQCQLRGRILMMLVKDAAFPYAEIWDAARLMRRAADENPNHDPENGKFTEGPGGGASGENESGGGKKATSAEERQKKIDSINIDFEKDNTLPELNSEDLEELGKESKPVLLKKSIIERNVNAHSEVATDQYNKILGNALYNSDLRFKGKTDAHNPDYVNFVKVNPGSNQLVLLEMADRKENYEIVHLFELNDKRLSRLVPKEKS